MAGRLAPAWDALSDPRIRVLSTDFFDTLAWRQVPEPVDAFALIGRRLVAEGLVDSRVDAAMFAKLREHSEHAVRARRLQSRAQSEIRLREIYAGLPGWVLARDRREAAVEVELAVERELLLPDLDVLELLHAARAGGQAVVVVSDTYYAERDLRGFLEDPGWDAPRVDLVLASSDRRVNKSGGLFEILLRELGVEAEAVFHLGDNPLADVDFPGRLGIGTLLYERRAPELERVLQAERRLSGPAGDGGVTALRAKAQSAPEAVQWPRELRPVWEFGAGVAGPVLAGYADWVVSRALAAERSSLTCAGTLVAELVSAAAAAREAVLDVNVQAAPGEGASTVRIGPLALGPVAGPSAPDAAPPPPSLWAPASARSARRARDVLDLLCAWPDTRQERALHAGVRAFQRERLRYVAAFPGRLEPLDEAADVLLAILERAVTEPTAREAQTLGRGGAPGPHADPADLSAPGGARAAWDVAARVHPPSATLLLAIGEGIVDPAAVSAPLEPGGLEVVGDGVTMRPVCRNWLGRSRLTAAVEGAGLTRLAFAAHGACAIRFDRIELRAADGSATPTCLSSAADLRRLATRDARWVDRTLLCRRRGAGLEIDVRALLGRPADRLEVECDFELLDLARP